MYKQLVLHFGISIVLLEKEIAIFFLLIKIAMSQSIHLTYHLLIRKLVNNATLRLCTKDETPGLVNVFNKPAYHSQVRFLQTILPGIKVLRVGYTKTTNDIYRVTLHAECLPHDSSNIEDVLKSFSRSSQLSITKKMERIHSWALPTNLDDITQEAINVGMKCMAIEDYPFQDNISSTQRPFVLRKQGKTFVVVVVENTFRYDDLPKNVHFGT
jgi:hypothetical protein